MTRHQFFYNLRKQQQITFLIINKINGGAIFSLIDSFNQGKL